MNRCLSRLAAACALTLAASLSQGATVLSETRSLDSPSTTDVTLQFGAFDPSLGDLISATLSVSGTATNMSGATSDPVRCFDIGRDIVCSPRDALTVARAELTILGPGGFGVS